MDLSPMDRMDLLDAIAVGARDLQDTVSRAAANGRAMPATQAAIDRLAVLKRRLEAEDSAHDGAIAALPETP